MERGTLRLAHSPDSDDLVMWWPLTGMRDAAGAPVPGELGTPRVDTRGFTFELVGEDVEALNRTARAGGAPHDITAISAATYPGIARDWVITRCGGSFGEGYGPKVVVRQDSPVARIDDLRGMTIAVPGTGTSAFLVLGLMLGRSMPAFDEAAVARGEQGKISGERGFTPAPMLFSEVPGAVVQGRADAGLLIHEAQLTFADLGLRLVADLGVWWNATQSMPLPLGLNVIRRDLDERFGAGACAEVSAILSESVAYAVEHAEESRRYLLMHSADRPEWRDAELVSRYLAMYVSGMSRDMGERGVEALDRMFALGAEAGELPPGVRADVV